MMKDEEKRRVLGLKDGERLPTFGKRKAEAPDAAIEVSEKDLADFRNEARTLLQRGRERSDAEWAEARAAGKKASLLNLIRRKQEPDEPEAGEDLSEEEEWRRRMSAAERPDNATD